MNERILEFARQTGLCDADGDFFGGKISQYEEFAQLMVRECIDITNDQYFAYEAVEALQKRFGVEE